MDSAEGTSSNSALWRRVAIVSLCFNAILYSVLVVCVIRSKRDLARMTLERDVYKLVAQQLYVQRDPRAMPLPPEIDDVWQSVDPWRRVQ